MQVFEIQKPFSVTEKSDHRQEDACKILHYETFCNILRSVLVEIDMPERERNSFAVLRSMRVSRDCRARPVFFAKQSTL